MSTFKISQSQHIKHAKRHDTISTVI